MLQFRHHWGSIVILAVFIFSSLAWIFALPFNQAPDERAHFRFNAQFMVEQRRLPVSGEDDLEQYTNCRKNGFGVVPCRYSYVVHPPLQYVGQAIGSKLFSELFGFQPYIGARLVNMLYGSMSIICIYASVYLVTRRRYIATLLAGIIATIPQIVFVSSYVNQDAFPLFAAAFAAFAIVRAYFELNTRNIAIVGVAAGFLLVSKYNFFILGPYAAVASLFVYARHGAHKNRKILKDVFWLSLPAMIIALPWYLRNILLYKDILGQNFVLQTMAKYHPLGIEQEWSIETMGFLLKNRFFHNVFGSFFSYLGYFNLRFEPWVYGIIFAICVVSFILLLVFLIIKRDKPMLLGLAVVLSLYVGSLLLTMHNTLAYDYQPQGRYLFPVITPTVLFLAVFLRKHTQVVNLLPVYFAASFTLLVAAHMLFFSRYFPTGIIL
jgi:hypothetical protein